MAVLNRASLNSLIYDNPPDMKQPMKVVIYGEHNLNIGELSVPQECFVNLQSGTKEVLETSIPSHLV